MKNLNNVVQNRIAQFHVKRVSLSLLFGLVFGLVWTGLVLTILSPWDQILFDLSNLIMIFVVLYVSIIALSFVELALRIVILVILFSVILIVDLSYIKAQYGFYTVILYGMGIMPYRIINKFDEPPFKLYNKKRIPNVGSCFECDGEYYKILPLLIESNLIVNMTNSKCTPKPLSIKQFHKLFPEDNRKVINSNDFFIKAKEYVESHIATGFDQNIEYALIVNLQYCCPDEWQENYGTPENL